MSAIERLGQGAPARLDQRASSSSLALESRPTLSIVVPTRNEERNVEVLTARIEDVIGATLPFEIVFVDDSTDSTPARIEELAASGHRVSLVHRSPSARADGLAGAVLAGFAVARGELLVVMDADLQHPPEIVPRLAEAIRAGGFDIAVASRFVPGGDAGGLDGTWRAVVSHGCRFLTRALVGRARPVRDPLSGFFAVRADVVSAGPRRSAGFKILLDVLALGQWRSVCEVPFAFAPRGSGASKASAREGLVFVRQALRLALDSRRPALGGRIGSDGPRPPR